MATSALTHGLPSPSSSRPLRITTSYIGAGCANALAPTAKDRGANKTNFPSSDTAAIRNFIFNLGETFMGARQPQRAHANLAQRNMVVFCLGSYAPGSALFLLPAS